MGIITKDQLLYRKEVVRCKSWVFNLGMGRLHQAIGDRPMRVEESLAATSRKPQW